MISQANFSSLRKESGLNIRRTEKSVVIQILVLQLAKLDHLNEQVIVFFEPCHVIFCIPLIFLHCNTYMNIQKHIILFAVS